MKAIGSIKYIFCSPLTRDLQTTHFTFGERFKISTQFTKKVVVWSALRSCDYPEAEIARKTSCPTLEGAVSKDRGTSITLLKQKLAQVKANNFLFHSEFTKEGWENDEKEYWIRQPRVDQVRHDLYNFARVAIDGGTWKGQTYPKYEKNGWLAVAIIANSSFLKVLTRDPSE